jgi:hypothetical protein
MDSAHHLIASNADAASDAAAAAAAAAASAQLAASASAIAPPAASESAAAATSVEYEELVQRAVFQALGHLVAMDSSSSVDAVCNPALDDGVHRAAGVAVAEPMRATESLRQAALALLPMTRSTPPPAPLVLKRTLLAVAPESLAKLLEYIESVLPDMRATRFVSGGAALPFVYRCATMHSGLLLRWDVNVYTPRTMEAHYLVEGQLISGDRAAFAEVFFEFASEVVGVEAAARFQPAKPASPLDMPSLYSAATCPSAFTLDEAAEMLAEEPREAARAVLSAAVDGRLAAPSAAQVDLLRALLASGMPLDAQLCALEAIALVASSSAAAKAELRTFLVGDVSAGSAQHSAECQCPAELLCSAARASALAALS